jgi:hypothetical protein
MLKHRQLWKTAGELKGTDEPFADNAMRLLPGNFSSGEGHRSLVWRELAGDYVEEGRLSGTVWTNEACQGSFANFEIHATQRGYAVKTACYARYREQCACRTWTIARPNYYPVLVHLD